MKDLIVLVADKNMKFGMEALLSRGNAFGMREIAFDVYVHPERDPSCLRRAHDFLRQYARAYHHALVMFDREGCGQEEESRERLECSVENLLSRNGWDDRTAAVIFDPELESWVWSDSRDVDRAFGWATRRPDLRQWLVEKRHVSTPLEKPRRPKEAMEEALRLVNKPRSSSLYGEIASTVNFENCIDPAFAKFRETLRGWFGN